MKKNIFRWLGSKNGFRYDAPAYKYPGITIPLEPFVTDFETFPTELQIEQIKSQLAYVWCDGYESKSWEKRPCRYLGIRITPSFILHETIGTGPWCLHDAERLVRKCRARLLTAFEFRVVLALWDEISEMRCAAGDYPLEEDAVSVWILYQRFCPIGNADEYWRCLMNGKLTHFSDFDDPAGVLLAVVND